MVLLVAGITVRFIPSVVGLFVGTFVTGVGIAIGNVTLPGLIKDRYPERVGLLTGVYSTSMTLFAATASGISIPLAEGFGFGWRGALGFWAIPAVGALLLWWPQVRAARGGEAREPRPGDAEMGGDRTVSMWRSPLAWQVTLFMGLQSLIYYVMVTWLPELLHSKGMTEATAGWMLSLAQYISLPTTLFVPMLADRMRDQRPIVFATCLLYAAGLAGFLSDATGWLVFGAICFGISLGTCIGLSLTFIGLRTRNARDAANLSAMAQSVGYLLAAAGPVLLGFVRDVTDSWNVSVAVLITLCGVMLVAGLGAGRDTTIATP